MLSGGSAFGLDAATGVMRYLEERGIGFKLRRGHGPDRAGGDPVRSRRRRRQHPPDGRLRLRGRAGGATDGPVAEGNVGAGAGATVGKMAGRDARDEGRHRQRRRSRCRTASSSRRSSRSTPRATSSIRRTGQVVAGVRTDDGKGLGRRAHACCGRRDRQAAGARRAAEHDDRRRRDQRDADEGAGDARSRRWRTTASPARSCRRTRRSDGDAIFALATGADRRRRCDTIGALAAEAMAEAIVRAVRAATGIPGYPAARDFAANAGRLTARPRSTAYGLAADLLASCLLAADGGDRSLGRPRVRATRGLLRRRPLARPGADLRRRSSRATSAPGRPSARPRSPIATG